MTWRVAFIGNSHLVALHAALRADPGRWPDLSARFHGFRGATVRDTAIDGTTLRPLTDAAAAQMRRFSGADRIDLTDADALVVVGFNVKVEHALTLWKDGRWPALPSLATAEDLAALSQTLLSKAAARTALAGYLSALTGFEIAARLRSGTGRPVYLIGHPRLHRKAKWAPTGRFFGLGRAVANGDAAAISALFEAAADSAARAADVRRVPQPRRTIAEHLMTWPRYMVDEIEVNDPAGHRIRREDLRHPAPSYGALMLDQLMRQAA